MPAALVPISALLLSVAILLMGNGLLGVLLPIRATALEFGSFGIGILGAAYFFGFGAGCLAGPLALRRVGHIRTFAALTSIACAFTLLHAISEARLVWWLARMGTGFCYAGLYITIESWLNERSTNDNRGFVFSAYTIVNLTVLTVGQLMITLGDPLGFFLFALSALLISLATVPVALTTSVAPPPLLAVKIRPLYLFERSPVGVMGCWTVGLANGSFWALGPVFAQSITADTAGVAYFMSLAVIAGAIGQWPLGHLSDRMDRRRIIILSCLGAAVAGLVSSLLPEYWPPALYVGAFLFGAFALPLYALAAAHLNDFVEPNGYVEASSGLLLIYAAGAVLGPLIASAIMRGLGGQGLFLFTATAHGLMAVYALYRITKRTLPADAERASFGETLLMTSMVTEIDPRSGEHSLEGDHEVKEQAEGQETEPQPQSSTTAENEPAQ